MLKFHEYTAIKRKELWEKFQSWYCGFIPQMAYKIGDDQLLTASYNAMLFGKGLLLNTESSIRQAYIHSGDTALLRKYDYLQELKNKLNWIRTSKINFDKKNDYTNYLLERIGETERGLISKYGGLSENMSIDERRLRSVLHDHELGAVRGQVPDASAREYIITGSGPL